VWVFCNVCVFEGFVMFCPGFFRAFSSVVRQMPG